MSNITLVEGINLALARAMEEDERVVVLGEDVGLNGGVFRATAGLQQQKSNGSPSNFCERRLRASRRSIP